MMSNDNRQNEVKLKVSIEEIVGSLLSRISVAKGPKEEIVKNMRTLIEETKNLLESRQKWDRALMRICGDMERQIEYCQQNKEAHKEITSSKQEEILQQNSSNEEEKIEHRWTELMENLKSHLKALRVDPSIISTTAQQKESVFFEETTTNEDDGLSNSNDQVDDAKEKLRACRDELRPQQWIWLDSLLSLGIFPLYILKRRLLVHWWIGLGQEPSDLASHEVPYNASESEHPNTTVEELAEKFFDYLVQKGILEPIRKKHSQVIKHCTIKPAIHRRLRAIFLWNLLRLRYCTIKLEIPKRLGAIALWNQQRLRYNQPQRKDINWHFVLDHRHRMRVLLNVDQKYLNSKNIASKDVLGDNNALQVVYFGRWQCTDFENHIEVDGTDFLKKLGENVIFLSLRGISMIDELPESIGELQNLRILDLRACHNLAKLPHKPQSKSRSKSRQESWFNNLTHLDISECYMLNHMPKWICELSNLEVFKGYLAGSDGNESQCCQLRDLSKLKKLRKLSIKIVKPLDKKDARELQYFISLSILTISWSINKLNNGENVDWTISFPENLEKLDIRCYPEADTAKLLNQKKLLKLKRLYIRGGNIAKIANGFFWTVDILRLRFLKFLEIDWYEICRTFPKLKHVEYKWCPKLKNFPKKGSWNAVKDGPFPELYEPRAVEMRIRSNYKVPVATNTQKILLELTGSDWIKYRPRLNLVAVLDVSESMEDENKIKNLKLAMLFVINKLSSDDRLSIVTVSDGAKTIWPLQQITESSRRKLENLVKSLSSSRSSNKDISDGLRMGLRILKDPNQNYSGIILISCCRYLQYLYDFSYIPETVAVHTFGLGSDHDEKVLKSIASDSMGGTYSQVVNSENLIKAVALCLAGLLTVAVQDLTLTLIPMKDLSIIKQVYAGNYSQLKHDGAGSVTIKFGDLYRGEVRKVLVDILFPAVDEDGDAQVLQVGYSYSLSGNPSMFNSAVIVRRKKTASAFELQNLPELFAEHTRLATMLMIIEPMLAAENFHEFIEIDPANNFLKARKIELHEINDSLESLSAELDELLKMTCPSGRSYSLIRNFLFSFCISHQRQRAASRGDDIEKCLSFATPFMLRFLREAEEFSANPSMSLTPVGKDA